jgi:N-methylhydantoinase B
MPHGVDRIATVSPHFSGSIEPESAGLAGAFPGATNGARLVAGSGVRAAFAGGRSIGGPDDIPGEPAVLPAVARMALELDDVLTVLTTGGGGFGDPIEREPERIGHDVRARLVTIDEALRVYGAVVDADGRIDDVATAKRRDAIRTERLGRDPERRANPLPLTASPDGWTEATLDGKPGVRCFQCGSAFPEPAGAGNPLEAVPGRTLALAAAGPHVGNRGSDSGFALRQRVCPSCGRSLIVERYRLEEPQ